MNKEKSKRELGRFQAEVLVGLWRLGGVGRLRDVGGAMVGRLPGVQRSAVYTTLMRLKAAGLAGCTEEKSEDGKLWRMEDGAYTVLAEWGEEVEGLCGVIAGLVDRARAEEELPL